MDTKLISSSRKIEIFEKKMLQLYLYEAASELLQIVCHSDAFPSSTLGGLDHDRVSDLLSSRYRTLHIKHTGRVKDFFWDDTLLIKLCFDSSSGPRDRWYFCCLSEDIGTHFVTKSCHYRCRWADKLK